MNRFAIVGAFCALIAGALVAHAVNARVSNGGVVRTAVVSPFELMVKAGSLPAESFDTI